MIEEGPEGRGGGPVTPPSTESPRAEGPHAGLLYYETANQFSNDQPDLFALTLDSYLFIFSQECDRIRLGFNHHISSLKRSTTSWGGEVLEVRGNPHRYLFRLKYPLSWMLISKNHCIIV